MLSVGIRLPAQQPLWHSQVAPAIEAEDNLSIFAVIVGVIVGVQAGMLDLAADYGTLSFVNEIKVLLHIWRCGSKHRLVISDHGQSPWLAWSSPAWVHAVFLLLSTWLCSAAIRAQYPAVFWPPDHMGAKRPVI